MTTRVLHRDRHHSTRSRAERLRTGAVLALLCGCADVQSQTPPAQETPMPAYTLHSVTEAALAEAARQTGTDRSKLSVVQAEMVTWRDGSLGCPQPGMRYTDALVPGFRVRIQAGERVLDYHASSRGGLMLCPEGRAVEPLPSDAV
jgi:hypothetical protein